MSIKLKKKKKLSRLNKFQLKRKTLNCFLLLELLLTETFKSGKLGINFY